MSQLDAAYAHVKIKDSTPRAKNLLLIILDQLSFFPPICVVFPALLLGIHHTDPNCNVSLFGVT